MRAVSFALGVLLLCSSSLIASAAEEGTTPLEANTNSKGSKQNESLTDSQIRKILIDESIAAYAGNCPCPYSRASNGSRCGRRSAWSRAGGEEPLCYPKDVSEEKVQRYRDAHRPD